MTEDHISQTDSSRRIIVAYIIAAALLASVCIFSLTQGAMKISPGQMMDSIFAGESRASLTSTPYGAETAQNSNLQKILILSIRLPRIILALQAGLLLAISGLLLQSLFRNPMADPALIGVSGGAMTAVVAGIVLSSSLIGWLDPSAGQASESTSATVLQSETNAFSFWSIVQPYFLMILAFSGGIIATFIVYSLAKAGNRTLMATMLLAGLAINALMGAVTGMFIYISDDSQLRDITFWTLGSLSAASWESVLVLLPVCMAAILTLPFLSKSMNGMMLGEVDANNLGIPVERIKNIILMISAVAVGAVVSVSGMIGFIGLIVPHIARLILGADHRINIIFTGIVGSTLLVLADTFARTIVSPAEIPIGIITSLIGAPFFLFLLLQQKKRLAI